MLYCLQFSLTKLCNLSSVLAEILKFILIFFIYNKCSVFQQCLMLCAALPVVVVIVVVVCV